MRQPKKRKKMSEAKRRRELRKPNLKRRKLLRRGRLTVDGIIAASKAKKKACKEAQPMTSKEELCSKLFEFWGLCYGLR